MIMNNIQVCSKILIARQNWRNKSKKKGENVFRYYLHAPCRRQKTSLTNSKLFGTEIFPFLNTPMFFLTVRFGSIPDDRFNLKNVFSFTTSLLCAYRLFRQPFPLGIYLHHSPPPR
jgi:hypothetical protein